MPRISLICKENHLATYHVMIVDILRSIPQHPSGIHRVSPERLLRKSFLLLAFLSAVFELSK